MNNPLGVSPGKRNQGTTRSKEKIFFTSVGIEPMTHFVFIVLRGTTFTCTQVADLGEGPGPWVKKEEMTEGKMADRQVNQDRPPPPPP